MTITEFLEARITEDEEEARKYQQYEDQISETAGWYDCTRVLAECAAIRAIIESHKNISSAFESEGRLENRLMLDGMEAGMRMALVALTFPYRDHPDYQQEWAA